MIKWDDPAKAGQSSGVTWDPPGPGSSIQWDPQEKGAAGPQGPPPAPTPQAEQLIQKYVKDPKQQQLQRLIVGIESGGGHPEEPNAYTAYGPYQITKDTATTYGLDYSKLNDLDYATASATKIIADLIRRAHGNRVQAAVGYNAGPGFIGTPFAQLPDGRTGGDDTQTYARRVAAGLAALNNGDEQTIAEKHHIIMKYAPSYVHAGVGDPLDHPEHLTQTPEEKKLAGAHVQEEAMFDPRGLKLLVTPGHLANVSLQRAHAAVDFAHRHPFEAAVDIMQAPERAAGTLLAATLDMNRGGWKNPWEVFHRAGHAFIDGRTHDKIINSIENGIMHDLGHPDFDATKATGWGKNAVDFATDFVIDPMNLVPLGPFLKAFGTSVKFLARVSHAAPIAKAVYGAAGRTQALAPLVTKTTAWGNTAYSQLQGASKVLKWLGTKRTDLDTLGKGTAQRPFFSKPGKVIRMGIESTVQHAVEENGIQKEAGFWGSNVITKPLQDNTYRDFVQNASKGAAFMSQIPKPMAMHVLENFLAHGNANAKAWAAQEITKLGEKVDQKLLAMPSSSLRKPTNVEELWKPFMLSEDTIKKAPYKVSDANKFFKQDIGIIGTHSMEDVMKHLLPLMRYSTKRLVIARETARRFLQSPADILHDPALIPGSVPKTESGLASWFLRNAAAHHDPVRILGPADRAMWNFTQNFKVAILGNPIPHGVINLGMVTLAHSNPFVVGRALAYMMKGVPKALSQRLEALGAKTSYWRETLPLMAAMPGAKQLVNVSTGILDHMETAWRASYLQYLDKTLKMPKGLNPLLHELYKGQTVNDHLGDYANPSGLAAALRALGGMYTVFRMDVVPRALLSAMKGRVGLSYGAGLKLQHDVFNTPYHGDLHLNIVDDMTKLVTSLPSAELWYPRSTGIDYLTSIASMGPVIGGVAQGLKLSQSQAPADTFAQTVAGLGSFLVPGVGTLAPVIMPNKDEARLPWWLRLGVHALGGWYQKRPLPKTIIQQEHRFRKAEHKRIKTPWGSLPGI